MHPEEVVLWQAVAETVQPRPGAFVPSLDVVPNTLPLVAPLPAPITAPSVAQPIPQRTSLPPIVSLEKRVRQRLSRGQTDVDCSLDLHGLRQEAAHQRLRTFLIDAQRNGARLALVVTGKGKTTSSATLWGDEGGVLRRSVPLWLREPDMRSVVVSVEEASRTHGGAGALYVRLRRLGRTRL